MSQIKKLQPGGTAPTPTPDRTELKKKLWDKFYTLSLKDQRKSHDQYKQVESLLDLPNFEEAVKFNPDRTYTVNVAALPENLKSQDWSGHQGVSLDKGFLGLQGYTHGSLFGTKEQNTAERQDRGLSSAMADLSSVISTTPTTTTTASTGYERVMPKYNDFLTSQYNNSAEVTSQAIGRMTEEEKSKFYVNNLKNLLTTYKTNYETNKATKGVDKYDEKEYNLATQALNDFNTKSSTGSTKLADYQGIFDKLGISTENFLKPVEPVAPKTEKQIQYETNLLARDTKNKQIADANLIIKENNKLAIAKNEQIKAENARLARVKLYNDKLNTYNKNRADQTGGATLDKGTGKDGEWTTADYLDATALAGDVTSLGGTIPGIIGGLTATASTLGSDILRGHSFGETAGNAAMNLGFTALALIPGAASIKLGVKGTKYAAKLAKIGNNVAKADKIIDTAKIAIKGVDEATLVGKELNNFKKAKALVETAEKLTVAEKAAKISKYGIPEAIKIAKAPIKAATKVLPYAQKAFVGYGLFNAGTAARQTAYDIEQGGLGNVSIQDLRGLTHGVQAAKGLYKMAQVHAGTTKSGGEVIQEATHEIKLKNVPAGVESKIVIPKNTKPTEVKAKIDEHFDKVITPKTNELTTLKAKTSPTAEETAKIEALTKELEVLNKGKAETIADNSIINKVNSFLGRNNKDYKKVSDKTRTIKSEADSRSWYGKKFQEKAIAKLKKGEEKALKSLKQDEKTQEIRRQYLSDQWANRKSTKVLSKKQGGIVKHQTSNGEGIVRNTIPGNYTKVPKNLNNYIPYGELTDFQKTPEWETFRKSISEQQFLEYLPDLNKQIAATKSSVQFTPKDYSKFTRLVTDQYSGPVQNFVMNKYQATLPAKIVQEPTPTTPTTPVTPAANPIVKTPISPDNKTGIAYKPTPKPINWGKIKVDPTDLVNTALALKGLDAVNRSTSKQIQAVTNVATKTMQPNQRVIMYNPYDRMAQNVKAEANTIGNRVGNAYSDGNKQMAAKLQMFNKGEDAAAGYREKGTELYNKGIQAQANSDYKTLVGNSAIADWNNASIKEGANKANMLESNAIAQKYQIVNNLGLSYLQNLTNRKREKDYSGLIAMQTGDEYKALRDKSKLYDDNAFAKAEAEYNAEAAKVQGSNPMKAWNQSQRYLDLMNAKAGYTKSVEDWTDRFNTAKMKLMYNQPQYAKKGGSLSKQDKIDIENIKNENKKSIEEVRLLYKTILANNKLMQDSLIKVFK